MNLTTLLGLLGLSNAKLYDDDWRESNKIHGHVTAAFTPIDMDGNLTFTNLPKMQTRLRDWGIPHVMLGGTTGESVSFSMAERMQVVDEWMKTSDSYGLKIYQHVGSDNVVEARMMAEAAAKKGIKGLFCMPPVYFKPMSIDDLVNVIAYVAAGAPETPIWYYHFPAKTGVDFNMFQFIEAAEKSGKIPNLMGVKFTNEILLDLTAIGFFKDRKYQMLFGRDEELTGALATGAVDGDVSSTVNFMSYNLNLGTLFNKYDKQSRDEMEQLQLKTVMVIQAWEKLLPGYNVQKAILKMTGIDFGPLREPQANLSHDQEMQLGTALKGMGLNITDEYVIPEMLENYNQEGVLHFLE